MDGCFDMMHYGHANALRQAATLGDELIIGLVPDEEIKVHKGPPVFNEGERRMAMEAVKWVVEVIMGVPYDVTDDLMNHLFTEHRIDYIVHGDDPCYTADGKDAYANAKRRGKYKEIKRTEGVSTTDIVGRMLMCTKRKPSLRKASLDAEMGELSPLQREFTQDEKVEGRASSFMPTSRRIVQFSSSKKIRPNSRVVYVDGSFDVFHPGHITLLREAKARGDFLLVGVWPDEVVMAERGPHFPILNVHERALSVLACCHVDEVVIGAPRVMTTDLINTFNISLVLRDDLDELDEESDRVAYAVPREMGMLQDRSSTWEAEAEATALAARAEAEAKAAKDGGRGRRWPPRGRAKSKSMENLGAFAGNVANGIQQVNKMIYRNMSGHRLGGDSAAHINVRAVVKGEGLSATERAMRPFTLTSLIARIVANRQAFEAKFAKKAAKESEYVEAKGEKAFVQEA